MPIQKDPEGIEVKYLHQFIHFTHAHILEVGCGDGRMTWRYADAASRVIGIDPDAGLLSTAQATCSPALRHTTRFMQTSAEKLPFADMTFDHVLLAWSL